jgi:hypothetical protein
MSRNDKEIDDVFRRRMEHMEVVPPNKVWNNIEQQLHSGKRKQRFLLLKLAAGIALLASTTFLLFTMLDEDALNPKSETAESMINDDVQKGEAEKITKPFDNAGNTANPTTSRTKNENNSSRNNKENANDRNRIVPADIQQEGIQEMVDEDAGQNILHDKNTSDAPREIQKKDSSIQLKPREEREMFHRERIKVIIAGREPDPSLKPFPPEKESADEGSQKATNTYWELTGNYGSAYSDRIISSSQLGAADRANINAVESGLISFGGGMGIRYNRNRWAFESGLYYSKFSQKNQQVLAPTIPVNTDYESAINRDFSSARKSNYLVNNSLGVIDYNSSSTQISSLNTVYTGDDVGSDSYNVGNKLNESLVLWNNMAINADESSIIQQVHFLELPLLARYRMLDKKFKLDITGGIAANIVTGTQVIFKKTDDKKSVGQIANINEFNVSGSFGIGLGYAVTNNVTFHLEPTFTMFLNSLNNEHPINFYPYQVGLFTGVSYALN